ncbi:MAG: M16 family metallopeptidase [Phycisphaeraceae bacterium]
MRRALLMMLTVVTALAPHAIAQAEEDDTDTPPEYTTLHQRSDRLIVELPNRMIVIAQRIPAAPVASAQVWVETGSIYEQQHNGAGLSHFLEHLVSGGTTSTRTEQESNAILGRIGAQTNAATSLDTVRYYINTTAEHTPAAVDLLSDWMQNSEIPQEEFERERQVIQREFSMGEGDPRRIFWKLTQQARYEAHPARHPTIGYLDEFMRITRDDIYDFYKTMYVPNNMVFVITGDIEPQETVEQVASLWKDVPAGDLPELSFPEEPRIDNPRALEGRADIQRPRLRLAWPGTQLAGEGDYALDLLGMILGQGETARLKQTVRDQQQLVTSIDAYNLSFSWGEGFFGVDAEVRTDGEGDDHIERVHSAILEQVKKLHEEPVSEAELKRAKRNVLANVLGGSQSAQAVASRLARDTIGMRDPDYLDKYAQRIQSVTAEQLQHAAQRFLQGDRLITIRLLPLEGQQPEPLTRPEAPDNTDDLPREPVHIDNAAKLDDMRTHLAESDATSEAVEVDEPVQFTLDNGLRVIVQRSTVVPAVAMQIYWKGGLLGETPGQEGVANAMATMLRRGTENYTADELARAVEDLGASLGASAGNNTTYARADALSEDWPRVLELLGEIVLRPTFPEDEWQRIQPRLLAAIDRQTDSWFGELSKSFRETYFGEHPWSQTPLGRTEVVQALTPEALRDYHAQQLGAQDAVLAVVGDVQPDEVRKQVEQVFGEMPGERPRAFDAESPSPADIELHQAQTQKPVTAVMIGFGPTVDRAHDDYAALAVLSRVFSNFPSGWLERELRGREGGLAYAAWAQHVTGLVPGYFSIAFNTSPDSAAEALDRTMRLVERARAGEIDDEMLARAKAKVLSNEFLGRQSNGDRATGAALDELYGAGDLEGEQFRRTVQALTVADVQAAARRYLNDPVAVVLSQQSIEEDTLHAALDGEEASSATQPAE